MSKHSDPPTGAENANAQRHERLEQALIDGEYRVGVHALVLVPVLRSRQTADDGRQREAGDIGSPVHSREDRLAEAMGLARAIDLDVHSGILIQLQSARPATLLGKGKVDELAVLIENETIEVVIVDHAVSPVQQRNLERAWKCKVLDRTGLILEIFGRRARTREGRLQVELAHLTYQRTRLVRAWTHLERQRGGAGFLGGPGERQLELDRRLIQDRIDALRKELEQVARTRDLHRRGRKKVPLTVVAIVGYTNAGKSTLFNAVTGAAVLAKDQVFATLDPTMREVRLPSGRRVILSDTVGFVSDLPTLLVAAFRATLEEVVEAELVLHVRDIGHPESEAQARDVEEVLASLGIEARSPDAAILEVWNKIDTVEDERRRELELRAARRADPACLVSATTGVGVAQLLAGIDRRLGRSDREFSLLIPASDGRLQAWLHANATVLDRQPEVEDATVIHMRVRLDADKIGPLASEMRRSGLPPPPD